MSTTVTITNGTYRGVEVHNQVFELVQGVKEGAKGSFITVRPNDVVGGDRDKIRINVLAENVAYDGEVLPTATTKVAAAVKQVVETDDEIMTRIKDRFAILEEMTAATMEGSIRAVIVSGPPGVGKSFGVTKQLEKDKMFSQIKNLPPRYEIVKGAMTAVALFTMLYKYSDANNVLVFDDCDSVLMDEVALNILKAALDSGKTRRISWSADSSYLRNEGIPNSFNFKGSVIFITNLQFNNVKSRKLQDHLAALQSRCHYLDLAMTTERDCMLRIKQVHNEGDLFASYCFTGNEGDTIIAYMEENKDRLRELSLRTAIKIADLVKISPSNWERLTRATILKNSF
jgi:predicted AAA+ superfamily ATPase